MGWFDKRRAGRSTQQRVESLEMLATSQGEALRQITRSVDSINDRMARKVDRDELSALRIELTEQRGMIQRTLDLSQASNNGLIALQRFLMNTTSEVRQASNKVDNLADGLRETEDKIDRMTEGHSAK